MSVPHFVHVFPTFGVGGVPIRIANVLNHFGRRYRHTIVALDGVHDARSRLRPELDVTLVDLGARKEGLAATWLAYARTLRRLRPDLLLTYNWGSTEWALVNTILRRAPHIHFESGFGPEESERQVPRRVWFRRVALRGAAKLVVPSTTLFDIASNVWRLRRGHVAYIPNGVDCERFASPPDPNAIPRFNKAAGEMIVGTLAPLRTEKNLGRLLRAVAALPAGMAWRCVIVGDGPERAALEALAAQLGIAQRTVFAGHVDAPERVLGLFDIFAITSDTEQMPNTILQAMAAGLPIAGVDVGDVKPMIGTRNRNLVVPKHNEAGLAAALQRLLTDAPLRTALGAENAAHVRAHYDQARMFAAYGDLFESALARRHRRTAAAIKERAEQTGRSGVSR
ncbi:MAG TPA: glycosyltransferase family 4 protein [Alphaproteobacteria bacterium]|nr:glycosyltransferase family 4 protein [Alphaproteobacteria bacterium]